MISRLIVIASVLGFGKISILAIFPVVDLRLEDLSSLGSGAVTQPVVVNAKVFE